MKTVTAKESIFPLRNSHCYAKVLHAFVTSYIPAPAVLRGSWCARLPLQLEHAEHLHVSAKACLIDKTVSEQGKDEDVPAVLQSFS